MQVTSDETIEVPGPAGPLRGTLVHPGRAGAPAVLIIPGSGPTDRDGNNPLGVHGAPYHLLARGLAAEGIGSLRTDKRGLFASAGAVAAADAVTMADYVADTRRWIAAMRHRLGIPAVWLLGHSEGGLVALAAAQRSRGIRGLVLVGVPGRSLGAVLRTQLRRNPANRPLLGRALPAIAALEAGCRVDTRRMPAVLRRLFRPSVQRFLRSAMSYDPATLLGRVREPVLILQGGRDLQVGVADAQALAAADPAARLVLLPRVNHVLKAVATDDVAANRAASADPALPLAPGIVAAIAAFVKAGR